MPFSKRQFSQQFTVVGRVHRVVVAQQIGVGPAQRDQGAVQGAEHAAAQAAKGGVDILIEPINTRDMPGYYLNRQDQAHAIVQTVGAANLRVQMDLYHCQIMEGDVATRLRQHLPTGRVGHIQIAGVPERHEPDRGELHYPYLFGVIDDLGYPGWVGCEYRPRGAPHAGGTRQGLGWMPKA